MALTPPALPGPRPPPSFRTAITGDLGQLAHLRQECGELLGTLPACVLGDVQLVVTELTANVLAHTARRSGQVFVRHDPDEIHIAVSDASPSLPHHVHDAAVGGRGIHIVDAIARTWGITSEPGGKTVWAKVAIS